MISLTQERKRLDKQVGWPGIILTALSASIFWGLVLSDTPPEDATISTTLLGFTGIGTGIVGLAFAASYAVLRGDLWLERRKSYAQ